MAGHNDKPIAMLDDGSLGVDQGVQLPTTSELVSDLGKTTWFASV